MKAVGPKPIHITSEICDIVLDKNDLCNQEKGLKVTKKKTLDPSIPKKPKKL